MKSLPQAARLYVFLLILVTPNQGQAQMNFLKGVLVDTALDVAGRIHRAVRNQEEEKASRGRQASPSVEKSVGKEKKDPNTGENTGG